MKRRVVIAAVILAVVATVGVGLFVVMDRFAKDDAPELSSDVPLADPPATSGKPLMPPEPGFYFSDVTRARGTGTEEIEILEASEIEPGVFEQTHWVEDDFGFQGLRFSRVRWYPNGSYAIASSIGVGDGACFFDPPVLATPQTHRVGDAWRTDSRCRGDDEPTRKSEIRVVGKATVNVGGEDVETFVIESLSFFEIQGVPYSNEAISWYSPKYRLTVKSEVIPALVDSERPGFSPPGSSSSRSTTGSSNSVIIHVLRSTQPS